MQENQNLKDKPKVDIYELSEINSLPRLAGLLLTITLSALNLGYVLSYLSLSITTLFSTLEIEKSEHTFRLSIINGVVPIGAFVGCLISYFLKKKLRNKNCLHLADFLGALSLLALIPNYYIITVFRFFLGVSNGINSVIMPIQLKMMCPEQYFAPFSMVIGYFSSTGILIGQLFGIGYLEFHGEDSFWWQIVFLFPSAVCLTRSLLMIVVYNFDSPETYIRNDDEEGAKKVISYLYKEERIEKVYEITRVKIRDAGKSAFSRIVKHVRHQRTVIIGVMANLVQQWCGSFAVFYYGAQINKELAEGDLGKITLYTISIGICMFFPQFLNIILQEKFGSKLLLQFSSLIMGFLNVAIVVFQLMPKDNLWLILTFVFMLTLIGLFSMILQPQTWSIISRLNEPDGAYLAMVFRWAFQMILILSFPYIVESISISGGFIIFACICFIFSIFAGVYIKDMRGMTLQEIDQWYSRQVEKVQEFQVL